jgi:hypothetical protein
MISHSSGESVKGEGEIENPTGEIATFKAPPEPGLTKIEVTVKQGEIACTAEALITVTETILPAGPEKDGSPRQGLPTYTFQKAPGELWRARYRRRTKRHRH